MELRELLNIKVLPHRITDSLYQLENKLFHLSYKDEVSLFTCVKNGDLQALFTKIKILDSITVGKMSDDVLQQYKYIAVSSMTLATRYAIEGGLNESDAYAYSDLFINKIDNCTDCNTIIQLLAQGIVKLTNTVAEEKKKQAFSPHIQKCITYISKNLNKKIKITDLADACNLSCDYLSCLFKKEMNENLSSYILRQKLETAKQLLLEGVDAATICTTLAFSSQSHFISTFKKQYSLTPKEFVSKSK